MKSIPTISFSFLNNEDVSKLVDKECRKSNKLLNPKSEDESGFFFIKSDLSSDKDIFLCSPPGTASHRAVSHLQKMLKINCGDGNLKQCSVTSEHPLTNDTIKVMFVRHPFDRLIMDFRHEMQTLSSSDKDKVKSTSRKLLFHRYRKWKKRKNDFHQFRKYIQTVVLSKNSTIKPLSQICQVCTKNYDLFLKLDGSLSTLTSLYSMSRQGAQDININVLPPQKTISHKQQRKYFSEITAEEMESLVNKFKNDFLYFGYNFTTFKRALNKSWNEI